MIKWFEALVAATVIFVGLVIISYGAKPATPPERVYSVMFACPTGKTIGVSSNNAQVVMAYTAHYAGIMPAVDLMKFILQGFPDGGPAVAEFLHTCMGK